MERVVVPFVEDSVVDLRKLHLTAHGCEILRNMGMNLTTDSEGLEKIKRAIDELGYRLKTCETAASGVKISKNLKECILWIVKNRGRKWKEIGLLKK